METLPASDEIKCSNPRCRAVIGRVIEIEGMDRFLIGTALCRVCHGVCVVCGKEFHYQAKNLKKTERGGGDKKF